MSFKKATVVIACLFLVIILLQSCLSDETSQRLVAPRGDVVLSEFYVPPIELPSAPGVLIRQETLHGKQTLATASRNIRLLYSSTEGLGGTERNAVSGALYLPKGTPPDEGWPLLVWSHGTVGIGDSCAPSYNGRSERDRTYLNPWLENGYAIAASDYQGLGTPGTHPYMDAQTMAYNNLDLIRAVQSADFPISKKAVIAGQSQGATGAIATAGLADDYASDVDLRGVLATGIPYLSQKTIMSMMKKTDRDAVNSSLALSLYMLTLTELVDPGFHLEKVLSNEARPIASRIGESCVHDFVEATMGANLSSNKAFSKPVDIAMLKAFSQMKYPSLQLDVPVFTGSGTADKVSPLAMQQAFIKDACKAGSKLVINTYEGANHNQGLLQSIETAQVFARAAINDEGITSNCS